MAKIKLEFPDSQDCRRISSNRIPRNISRGITRVFASRFIGGLLNDGRHLYWSRLESLRSTITIGELFDIFTFIPYRLYGGENGGIIDGVHIFHRGHEYGFKGGNAMITIYQPRDGVCKRIRITCIPWRLYFIYQFFEDFYIAFELKERLYIPHWLLPKIHTP